MSESAILSLSVSIIYYALSVLKIHGLPYRRKLVDMLTYYPSKFYLLHGECNGQLLEVPLTSRYN